MYQWWINGIIWWFSLCLSLLVNMVPVASLASASLGEKLGALYSSSKSLSFNEVPSSKKHQAKQQPTKSLQIVHAIVLDTPPLGLNTTAYTAPAAYLPQSQLQHLRLSDGDAVLLMHAVGPGALGRNATSVCRTARVQLVAVPDAAWQAAAAPCRCSSNSSSRDGIFSSQAAAACTTIGLSPLTAHNLGLLHQLQPFLAGEGPGQGGFSNEASSGPDAGPTSASSALRRTACFVLQLEPAEVPALTPPPQQQLSVAGPIAESVTICKVGQPLVTPLSGLVRGLSAEAASAAAPNPSSTAGAAAGGSSSNEQQLPSGPGVTGAASNGAASEYADAASSSGAAEDSSNELLLQLQAHFLQHAR